MAYCTSCGKQNPDNTKFCTGCGASLKKEIPAPPGKSLAGNKTWPWLVLIGVLAAATAAWFLFFQHKKTGDAGTANTETTNNPAPLRDSNTGKESNKGATAHRTITVRYKDFSMGDLPHYTFTDISTGTEMELEMDESAPAGWQSDWNELSDKCSDEGANCPLTGQQYTVVQEMKEADIFDWDGEKLVKTGRREKRWLVTQFKKTGNDTKAAAGSDNPVSYLGPDGRLVYKTDCYVIITGSFANMQDAINDVKRMRREGYPNAGYLWIPDYPSMSGKAFYAPFIGPFETYDACRSALSSLGKTGRFWYGLKVSMNNERVEIRL